MATLKELKKFARKLNKLDLAEEIDLDQEADDLEEEFISAIEEIDDEGQTDDVDDDVLDFYEGLIDEGDEDEDEDEDEEEDEENGDEEEDEDEEDEDEDEGDEYDDMDRKELVKVAKGLGIKCLRSMTEDDYREAIRDAAEEDEDEEEEPPPKKKTTRRKRTARKPAKKTTRKRTTGKRTTTRKRPAKKTTAKKTTRKRTAAKKKPAVKKPTGVAEVVAQQMSKVKGKNTKYATLADRVAKQRGKEGAPADMNTARQYVRIIASALLIMGFAKEVNEDTIKISK